MSGDGACDTPGESRASVGGLILASAEQFPEEVAVSAPGRSGLTYRDLAALIGTVGGQLAASGVRPGDRVAVVLSGGAEAATAFLAVAAYTTCAPINPAYGADEFDFYLSDLAARAVIVDEGSDSPAVRVAHSRGIAVLHVRREPGAAAGRFRLEGCEPGQAVKPRFAGPRDVALVLHTSGTTSRPKLVPLTHANLRASAFNVARSLALGPGDRCLNIMPLFHVHGLVAATLASAAVGAEVACCPGFVAPDFFAWLDECRPTWYSAVPTMHQAILARAGANTRVIERSRLRLIRSSSSALAPSVLSALEQVFGTPVIEAYGMTEAAHQISSNPLPPKARKPGTVGVAAGPEIAIMGAVGRLLPPGGVGEIVIRGDNVTPGYERNADANRAAFADGWFRTGDQGALDADGYLTITGRLKEIINRGGEKVAPREVDEALLRHPDVAQAVTFGVPHPRLGEEVAAAVVPRPGSRAREADLRAFVAGHLAYFKVPARVLFLDELPKGPTGKPRRVGLAGLFGLTAEDLAPKAPPGENVDPVAAPRDDLETLLARFWAEVLRVETVGIGESFLELGGDSILATQVVARVRSALGVDLPIVTLFAAPTVAGMARAVRSALEENPPAEDNDLDRIVAELERLSDEETRRLLAEEGASPPGDSDAPG